LPRAAGCGRRAAGRLAPGGRLAAGGRLQGGVLAAGRWVTKEVRSGEIGFSGPGRKNNFTAQQGRRRQTGLAAAKQGSPPPNRARRRTAVGKMGWFCTPPGHIHDPLAHIHTHDPIIVSLPYTNLQFFPIFLHFRVRTVHQFTIFPHFPALSCTPRTPIYNFWPYFCTFVYAPFRPQRTLCGRCHFRGYTHRNRNCQSPDYHHITGNDRGRCPPYFDTYRSRLADGE